MLKSDVFPCSLYLDKHPLHKYARDEGSLSALRECLERGYYSVNSPDSKKFTALHWAAW